MRRQADDPAFQLADEVNRYLDSLYVAAEHRLGPAQVARLDAAADRIVPDLTHADAWPTLRAHLLLLSAQGLDPVHELHEAATIREVDTAGDVASVLDWRLDDTGLRSAGTGPLPWLPGIPEALVDDPQWGPYLAARAARVRDLRDQIAEQVTATAELPSWARQGQGRPSPELLVDVAVWRAAMSVDPADRRPTGPTQLAKAPNRWQTGLNTRLAGNRTPALAEWADVLDRVLVHPRRDPFYPLLAERLSAISRAGLDAPAMVRRALAEGALPDDHNAAALWWRIAGRLAPAVASQVAGDHHLTTAWADRLPELLGPDQAAAVRQSSWWPTLVAVVDHAIARGTPVDALLTNPPAAGEDLDPCQALVWRLSILTDPPPTDDEQATWPDLDPHDDEPNPFWDDLDQAHWSPTDQEWEHLQPADTQDEQTPNIGEADLDVATDATDWTESSDDVSSTLAWAARAREFAGILPPTDREIDTQLTRAYDADTAPVGPTRILELNRIALDFYTEHFPRSWAQTYLTERVGADLAGDPHVQPGYAPAGWTNLVSHLRRHGATDLELTESGLATTTRNGRIIDRFRDRLIFPITRTTLDGGTEPLGFVGRRSPRQEGVDAGPKYLNTPDTALFHKGAQLHIVREDLLAAGATPVLVEGPMDALAVTMAGQGQFVGVAPLGTSLTEEQAAQLARLAHENHTVPVVATDADLAGQVAAHRDYWLLAQHALAPSTVRMRPGSDPADLLAFSGPEALSSTLQTQEPLAEVLLTERLTHLHGLVAARQAVLVLAADCPTRWEAAVDRVAATTGIPADRVRRELAAAVRRWDNDPREVTGEQLTDLTNVRTRMAPPPAAAVDAVDAPRAIPADHLSETPQAPAPRR
jgi:DNA primase catalytic core